MFNKLNCNEIYYNNLLLFLKNVYYYLFCLNKTFYFPYKSDINFIIAFKGSNQSPLYSFKDQNH